MTGRALLLTAFLYTLTRGSGSYELSGDGYVLVWNRTIGFELYARADAERRKNLAAKHPETAATLAERLLERLDRDGWTSARTSADDAKTASEALRRMGYRQ